jgi:hypothetical protein
MQNRRYEPDRDRDAVLRIWREAGWIETDNPTQNEATAAFATVGEALVAELDGAAECFVSTAPGELRYLDTDLPMSAVTAVITSHVARIRRANGRTPPKPDRPTEEKPKKSARRSGRLWRSGVADVTGETASIVQPELGRFGVRR